MNLTEHDAYEDVGTENWPRPMDTEQRPSRVFLYLAAIVCALAVIGLADVVQMVMRVRT